MNPKLITAAVTSASLLTGLSACNRASAPVKPENPVSIDQPIAGPDGLLNSSPVNAMPMALIYKMNGDFSQNVPITVSKGELISYPAPTDLFEGSEPLPLADGFWLDRRGIGPNTRFTSYTYVQYRALQEPPSTAELLKNIIPGAAIIQLVSLPFTTTAVKDTTEVNRLIREGLPGCRHILNLAIEKPE